MSTYIYIHGLTAAKLMGKNLRPAVVVKRRARRGHANDNLSLSLYIYICIYIMIHCKTPCGWHFKKILYYMNMPFLQNSCSGGKAPISNHRLWITNREIAYLATYEVINIYIYNNKNNYINIHPPWGSCRRRGAGAARREARGACTVRATAAAAAALGPRKARGKSLTISSTDSSNVNKNMGEDPKKQKSTCVLAWVVTCLSET